MVLQHVDGSWRLKVEAYTTVTGADGHLPVLPLGRRGGRRDSVSTGGQGRPEQTEDYRLPVVRHGIQGGPTLRLPLPPEHVSSIGIIL
jgi:hypothetical protein